MSARRLGRFAFILSLTLTLPLSVHAADVSSGPKDWPQWRGPQRDGISVDKKLLKEWPKTGPKVLWQVDTVGVGYSSLAIKDGRIYTQGDLNGVEHIICLSAKDGSTIWAVQPAPVAEALTKKIAEEMKAIDKNADGKIDEVEALGRFGWNFNKFDQPLAGADVKKIALQRAAALLKTLDTDGDGKLSFAEAGKLLGEDFTRIDASDDKADAAALAKSRAAALLTAADADKDGKVSKAEAKNTPLDRNFGRIDKQDPATKKGDQFITAEELTEFLAKEEKGKDGLIILAELEKHYLNRTSGGDGILTAVELRGAYGGLRDGQGDGPRGTPTIDGNRLYVEGGMGDVTCLDVATGKTIWHINLTSKEFGGNRPGWGYSESPLIEGNLVIVTPGGKLGTLAALDKETGKVMWRSTGITEGAHYSSPIAADIIGVRTIVQFASSNVFGVSAADGKLLWKYSGAANGTANCTTPIVDGDLVFTSSSYSTGGGLAKVSGDSIKQSAEEVYFEKKMANHHGGIIKVGDHMYGFGNGGLICMDFRTGKIAWQARSVSKGSLTVADGMLYLLGENHEVALAEVNPEKYVEHGRFKIEGRGRPSWAHPVVIGGKFYLRDQNVLTVYDVRE